MSVGVKRRMRSLSLRKARPPLKLNFASLHVSVWRTSKRRAGSTLYLNCLRLRPAKFKSMSCEADAPPSRNNETCRRDGICDKRGLIFSDSHSPERLLWLDQLSE